MNSQGENRGGTKKKIGCLHVSGENYDLYRGENIVGSNDSCTVVFKSKAVDGVHAVITVDDPAFPMICDKGSKYKTKLGKNVLEPHRIYCFPDNAKIIFGNIKAIYVKDPDDEEEEDEEEEDFFFTGESQSVSASTANGNFKTDKQNVSLPVEDNAKDIKEAADQFISSDKDGISDKIIVEESPTKNDISVVIDESPASSPVNNSSMFDVTVTKDGENTIVVEDVEAEEETELFTKPNSPHAKLNYIHGFDEELCNAETQPLDSSFEFIDKTASYVGEPQPSCSNSRTTKKLNWSDEVRVVGESVNMSTLSNVVEYNDGKLDAVKNNVDGLDENNSKIDSEEKRDESDSQLSFHLVLEGTQCFDESKIHDSKNSSAQSKNDSDIRDKFQNDFIEDLQKQTTTLTLESDVCVKNQILDVGFNSSNLEKTRLSSVMMDITQATSTPLSSAKNVLSYTDIQQISMVYTNNDGNTTDRIDVLSNSEGSETDEEFNFAATQKYVNKKMVMCNRRPLEEIHLISEEADHVQGINDNKMEESLLSKKITGTCGLSITTKSNTESVTNKNKDNLNNLASKTDNEIGLLPTQKINNSGIDTNHVNKNLSSRKSLVKDEKLKNSGLETNVKLNHSKKADEIDTDEDISASATQKVSNKKLVITNRLPIKACNIKVNLDKSLKEFCDGREENRTHDEKEDSSETDDEISLLATNKISHLASTSNLTEDFSQSRIMGDKHINNSFSRNKTLDHLSNSSESEADEAFDALPLTQVLNKSAKLIITNRQPLCEHNLKDNSKDSIMKLSITVPNENEENSAKFGNQNDSETDENGSLLATQKLSDCSRTVDIESKTITCTDETSVETIQKDGSKINEEFNTLPLTQLHNNIKIIITERQPLVENNLSVNFKGSDSKLPNPVIDKEEGNSANIVNLDDSETDEEGSLLATLKIIHKEFPICNRTPIEKSNLRTIDTECKEDVCVDENVSDTVQKVGSETIYESNTLPPTQIYNNMKMVITERQPLDENHLNVNLKNSDSKLSNPVIDKEEGNSANIVNLDDSETDEEGSLLATPKIIHKEFPICNRTPIEKSNLRTIDTECKEDVCVDENVSDTVQKVGSETIYESNTLPPTQIYNNMKMVITERQPLDENHLNVNLKNSDSKLSNPVIDKEEGNSANIVNLDDSETDEEGSLLATPKIIHKEFPICNRTPIEKSNLRTIDTECKEDVCVDENVSDTVQKVGSETIYESNTLPPTQIYNNMKMVITERQPLDENHLNVNLKNSDSKLSNPVIDKEEGNSANIVNLDDSETDEEGSLLATSKIIHKESPICNRTPIEKSNLRTIDTECKEDVSTDKNISDHLFTDKCKIDDEIGPCLTQKTVMPNSYSETTKVQNYQKANSTDNEINISDTQNTVCNRVPLNETNQENVIRHMEDENSERNEECGLIDVKVLRQSKNTSSSVNKCIKPVTDKSQMKEGIQDDFSLTLNFSESEVLSPLPCHDKIKNDFNVVSDGKMCNVEEKILDTHENVKNKVSASLKSFERSYDRQVHKRNHEKSSGKESKQIIDDKFEFGEETSRAESISNADVCSSKTSPSVNVEINISLDSECLNSDKSTRNVESSKKIKKTLDEERLLTKSVGQFGKSIDKCNGDENVAGITADENLAQNGNFNHDIETEVTCLSKDNVSSHNSLSDYSPPSPSVKLPVPDSQIEKPLSDADKLSCSDDNDLKLENSSIKEEMELTPSMSQTFNGPCSDDNDLKLENSSIKEEMELTPSMSQTFNGSPSIDIEYCIDLKLENENKNQVLLLQNKSYGTNCHGSSIKLENRLDHADQKPAENSDVELSGSCRKTKYRNTPVNENETENDHLEKVESCREFKNQSIKFSTGRSKRNRHPSQKMKDMLSSHASKAISNQSIIQKDESNLVNSKKNCETSCNTKIFLTNKVKNGKEPENEGSNLFANKTNIELDKRSRAQIDKNGQTNLELGDETLKDCHLQRHFTPDVTVNKNSKQGFSSANEISVEENEKKCKSETRKRKRMQSNVENATATLLQSCDSIHMRRRISTRNKKKLISSENSVDIIKENKDLEVSSSACLITRSEEKMKSSVKFHSTIQVKSSSKEMSSNSVTLRKQTRSMNLNRVSEQRSPEEKVKVQYSVNKVNSKQRKNITKISSSVTSSEINVDVPCSLSEVGSLVCDNVKSLMQVSCHDEKANDCKQINIANKSDVNYNPRDEIVFVSEQLVAPLKNSEQKINTRSTRSRETNIEQSSDHESPGILPTVGEIQSFSKKADSLYDNLQINSGSSIRTRKRKLSSELASANSQDKSTTENSNSSNTVKKPIQKKKCFISISPGNQNESVLHVEGRINETKSILPNSGKAEFRSLRNRKESNTKVHLNMTSKNIGDVIEIISNAAKNPPKGSVRPATRSNSRKGSTESEEILKKESNFQIDSDEVNIVSSEGIASSDEFMSKKITKSISGPLKRSHRNQKLNLVLNIKGKKDEKHTSVDPENESGEMSLNSSNSKLIENICPGSSTEIDNIPFNGNTSIIKRRKLKSSGGSNQEKNKISKFTGSTDVTEHFLKKQSLTRISIRKSRKKLNDEISPDFTSVTPPRNSENNIIQTPTSSSRVRRKVVLKENVLFTCVNDQKYANMIAKLGGEVIDTPTECTVLVTDKVRRTVKFLCVLSMGKPIVSLQWIIDSNKAGCFLDPWRYIICDKEAEDKFKFNLTESLKEAKQKPMLDGFTIFVTPSVKPPPDEMKSIILSSGGIFSGKQPAKGCDTTIVVSCFEDKSLWPKLKKKKFNFVVSTEAILTGVLKQSFFPEDYIIVS